MRAMRNRLGVITGAITVGVAAMSLAGCGGGATGQNGATALPPPPPVTTTPKLVTGSPTYDKIVKRGKLVVGLAESPGLAARQPDGSYAGFEVEIARLLAANLGLTEQDVLFKALPPGLRRDAVVNGDVDIQLGGVTSGSAEPGKLAVAGPYLATPPGLLTKSGGVDAVHGKPVCVPKDSAALAALQQDGLTLHVGDTLADCHKQLDAGSVAGIADDAAPLLGLAATQPNTYHESNLPGTDTQHGVGVPYRDHPFRTKLDEILRTTVQSGDWQRRYDRTLGAAGTHLQPPTVADSTTAATPTPATPTS